MALDHGVGVTPPFWLGSGPFFQSLVQQAPTEQTGFHAAAPQGCLLQERLFCLECSSSSSARSSQEAIVTGPGSGGTFLSGRLVWNTVLGCQPCPYSAFPSLLLLRTFVISENPFLTLRVSQSPVWLHEYLMVIFKLACAKECLKLRVRNLSYCFFLWTDSSQYPWNRGLDCVPFSTEHCIFFSAWY